ADGYQGPAALLHGDFMRKNILVSHTHGLVAIDPNPATGDPSYDVAQWSLTEGHPEDAIGRSAEIARSLDLPTGRAAAWIAVLLAVEISLAPLSRAIETHRMLSVLQPEWWKPR